MSHGLPNPPTEPPVQRDVECLAPKFRSKVVAMLAAMSALGFDPVISESCRTRARHGFGLAVDVISQRHGWEPSPRFWQTLGQCAIEQGLSWGGAWDKFPDRPHVQFGAPMRQAPSARAAELLAEGGMPAVWKEVQAI